MILLIQNILPVAADDAAGALLKDARSRRTGVLIVAHGRSRLIRAGCLWVLPICRRLEAVLCLGPRLARRVYILRTRYVVAKDAHFRVTTGTWQVSLALYRQIFINQFRAKRAFLSIGTKCRSG